MGVRKEITMDYMKFNKSHINEQLVEKQLRMLEARRRTLDKKTDPEPGLHFLTIAKDEGSLGNEIIEELSKQLEWHVFDEEIIHYIAQNNHVSEKLVRRLDQTSTSNMQEIIERFFKNIEVDSFSRDQYREGLLRTLIGLAKHGSAILVGRGGNFVLNKEKSGLKVRITASPEVRVRRLEERWKVSAEETQQRMRAEDEKKKKFIRHYYWHDYDDERFYDVTYNTDRIPVEDVVSSILGLLKGRLGLKAA